MLLRGFALALAALFAVAASAQSYPAKPVHVIVPYSTGTPSDAVARIAAAELQMSLAKSFLVENRPGAAGTIGLAELARQPADGYTLLALAMPSSVAPALYPDARLDLPRDFSGVGQITFSYNVLVAHPSVAARNVAELVAMLKAEPGRYSFGSGGNGTPTHLAAELFRQESGVEARHVPYNLLPQALADLVTGRLQYMFFASAPALPHIRSRGLRALAVTGPKRLDVLKDTPTMIEAGFPGFVIRDWVGLIARSGTPRPVIERLNSELNRLMADPDLHVQLGRMGAEVATGTPHEFDELIASEVQRWSKLVRSAGVKAD